MGNEVNQFQYIGLVAYVTAFVVTRLLIFAHLNDAPNESRKLHLNGTATAGGLAIIFGIGVAGFMVQRGGDFIAPNHFVLVFGIAAIFGAIGLIDDVYTLSSKFRLAILIAISFAVGLSPFGIQNIPIWDKFAVQLLPIIGALGTMIWLVLVPNCVNFMDGANGLSIGSVAISLLFVALLSIVHGDVSVAMLGLVGACSCAGFLTFNATKGNIFAGDVGSYFVGAYFALIGLLSVKAGVSPFAIAICLLPILGDAILTIFHRLSLGENILLPHQRHIYQMLILKSSALGVQDESNLPQQFCGSFGDKYAVNTGVFPKYLSPKIAQKGAAKRGILDDRRANSHLKIASIWWLQTIACGGFALLVDKYWQKGMFVAFLGLLLFYILAMRSWRKKLA